MIKVHITFISPDLKQIEEKIPLIPDRLLKKIVSWKLEQDQTNKLIYMLTLELDGKEDYTNGDIHTIIKTFPSPETLLLQYG